MKLFDYLYVLRRMTVSLFAALYRQKLLSMVLVAFLLLALTVLFHFLATAPVLSPFIYPLF